MKTKFTFNENTGITTCTIEVNQLKIKGIARKHPEETAENRFAGEEIAYNRAIINLYKWIIRNELKPQIKQLNHIMTCYTMNRTLKEALKVPEIKIVYKELKRREEEVEIFKDIIAAYKYNLSSYINSLNSLGQKK